MPRTNVPGIPGSPSRAPTDTRPTGTTCERAGSVAPLVWQAPDVLTYQRFSRGHRPSRVGKSPTRQRSTSAASCERRSCATGGGDGLDLGVRRTDQHVALSLHRGRGSLSPASPCRTRRRSSSAPSVGLGWGRELHGLRASHVLGLSKFSGWTTGQAGTQRLSRAVAVSRRQATSGSPSRWADVTPVGSNAHVVPCGKGTARRSDSRRRVSA